jgi:hypothetical protein
MPGSESRSSALSQPGHDTGRAAECQSARRQSGRPGVALPGPRESPRHHRPGPGARNPPPDGRIPSQLGPRESPRHHRPGPGARNPPPDGRIPSQWGWFRGGRGRRRCPRDSGAESGADAMKGFGSHHVAFGANSDRSRPSVLRTERARRGFLSRSGPPVRGRGDAKPRSTPVSRDSGTSSWADSRSPSPRTRDLHVGGQLISGRWSAERHHPLPRGRLGEPVGGALGEDDVGVVEEPVDGGRGQGLGHDRVEP